MTSRTRSVAAAISAVVLVSLAIATIPAKAEPAVERYLVIGTHGSDPARPGGPVDDLHRAAVAGVDDLGFAVVEATPAEAAALRQRPDVKAVVEDIQFTTALDTSRVQIGVNALEALGADGTGQTIAVLDDGFDLTHPTFAGITVQEACFTSGDGLCPNGEEIQIGPGAAAVINDSDHGTAVAAVAVGRGGDGVPPGIAAGADLIAINPFGSTNSARASSILASLDHVRTLGDVVAVNLSLEFRGLHFDEPCDDTSAVAELFANAFDLLDEHGAIITVASGNESNADGVSLPACIDVATAVGASVEDGESPTIWPLTDRGAALDLLAPGVGIVTARAGGSTTLKSGTSFSAPHVAGAAALLRDHYGPVSPGWIRSVLAEAGIPVVEGALTVPRVDLTRVLEGSMLRADDRADATPLVGTNGIVYSHTVGATREVDEPAHDGASAGGSVWYSYQPTTSGTLVLDTDGSIAPIAVVAYNQGAGSALVARGAGSSQQSSVVVNAGVPGDGGVLVAVQSLDEAGGATEIHWQFVPTAPGTGDGIGVRRATRWFQRDSATGGFQDRSFDLGDATGTPISGDWDGNGTDTPGIIDGREFKLWNSTDGGEPDLELTYGRLGDTPVTGDWNGDGIDTVGVRRNNVYYLRNSHTSGVADLTIGYGKNTDVPVVGDWDGNGTDTLGVRRGSVWYLRNDNSTGVADATFGYGYLDDIPIVGDWDGNNTDTPGVHRGRLFLLRNENSAGPVDKIFSFGLPGDTAVVGNWDGR